jgi:WD40 repeat protein
VLVGCVDVCMIANAFSSELWFVADDHAHHRTQSNFLLSASMDKTVRLWHVTKAKCLSLYQHSDFVTAVAFHPNVCVGITGLRSYFSLLCCSTWRTVFLCEMISCVVCQFCRTGRSFVFEWFV